MSYTRMGTIVTECLVTREPDRSGNFVCDGTADDVEIQAALDYLTAARTWQEKVVLKGNFTISAPIVVSGHTWLELIGKVTLANGVNDNMIENANPATNDPNVVIEGGIWDGNGANQMAGDIIYWTHGTSPATFFRNEFRNMSFIDSDTYDIHIPAMDDARTTFMFYNLHSRGTGTGSLHLTDMSDLIVSNWIPCNDPYLHLCSFVKFDHLYIQGTAVLDYVTSLQMSNCSIDTAGELPLDLYSCAYSNFSNIVIRVIGDGAAVARAVRVGSPYTLKSTNNQFSNIYMGRALGAETRRFTLGIEEIDADQINNLYCNIDGADCVTAALRLRSVTSQWTNVMGDVMGN